MTFRSLILVSFLTIPTSACTAISVVDAVASTAVDVTVGAVKATGKVIVKLVDVVTPDAND
ncbi:MAG: hypothetical protein ACI9NY_000300 [Kiritimatiellia bacterium]|jgi:hypothetical protein